MLAWKLGSFFAIVFCDFDFQHQPFALPLVTNDLAILKLLFGLAYPKKTLVTPVSAALVKSAKQSMVLIAECVPATFVSVITTDFLISKVVQDKIGALRILSLVIKKVHSHSSLERMKERGKKNLKKKTIFAFFGESIETPSIESPHPQNCAVCG